MKNVYIYCEVPTEESFINQGLYPYFLSFGVFVYPIICTTKRTTAQKYKGGVSSYAKIQKELTILCHQHRNEYVTTMFDYYAMPDDAPGMTRQDADVQQRILAIEQAIDADIAQRNCHFHFMLHEFEGILFSKPDAFSLVTDADTVRKIQAIRNSYPTPEHIDHAPATAPSKRLKSLIPGYAKVKHGTLLSKAMGLDVILEQCPHFRAWIQAIFQYGRT